MTAGDEVSNEGLKVNTAFPAWFVTFIDNGPQRRLTQLLPSSTVAAGCSVNGGAGSPLDSFVPGGTCQPGYFSARDVTASTGTRAPLQYMPATVVPGANRSLVPEPASDNVAALVSTE